MTVKSVVEYHAVCDDSTNDTNAVNNALSAVGASTGGGTVVVPGRCAVDPDVLELPSNVTLVGTGKRSWLRLRGAGLLLDHSGTATGFANHVNNSAIYNLSLNGGGFTGTLLKTFYADNLTVRGARFENVDGKFLDAVELWDTDFLQCVVESTSSATVASADIRCAASGADTDNSNMIKFAQCRFEGFRFGALRFWRGGFGSNNPNGLFIDSCKFETHSVRGMPIYIDDTAKKVDLHKVEGFMGAFDSGYSTVHPFITCNAPGGASLRDIRGVAEEAASMASVVESFNNGSHVIDDIFHEGSFNPTAVVNFAGGTGRWDIGNVYSTTGATLFAGAHPENRSTTYAASLTPALASKRTTHRVTLTGNITINVPTGNGRQLGDRIRFELLQDGTGGRTTTFGAGYRVSAAWVPVTTANRLNVIEFEFNGTDWMSATTAVNIT